MSELKATSSGEIRTRNALLGYWWYEKSEADKVIAEKDAEIAQLQAMLEERNKQVGELKHSLELASNECCSISERAVKNERRLKRALWLARAERAKDRQTYYTHTRGDGWVHKVDQWIEVERKCLNKAEEYR